MNNHLAVLRTILMKRCVFAVLFLFFTQTVLFSADKDGNYSLADFMRTTKADGKTVPQSYDIAVVKFTDAKKNIEIDLIGAVHIGDREYYAELNQRFKQYDAVLYELVADAGMKPPKAGKRSKDDEPKSLISAFQTGMGEALELKHQLEYIDYHAENMVHADLSPDEFFRRVSDRGDFAQMVYRALMLGVKKSGQESQHDEFKMQGRLLGTIFSPDPALALKRILAGEMMNQMNDAAWVIGGDGSAIITDRNNAALKVLRREMKKGKKKIAIFYGAAHLAEFAKSLENEFQMKHTGTDWVTAWDLTKDKTARDKTARK